MIAGTPRVARLLLRLLPESDREYVLGDLEERYVDRVAARGSLRARIWFWRQVVTTLWAFLIHARPFSGWSEDAVRAIRSLALSPAFTALSVATLALGIGTVTAMFTVLDQVVLRPLPVRDQDRIVVAWNHHTVRDIPHYPFLWDAYQAVEAGVSSLENVAATSSVGSAEVLARIGDGEEEVLRRSWVIGDVFGVLGVVPSLGRLLRPEDDVRGAPRVAVISYELWTRAWDRSPQVPGTAITLADERYTIVGVLPRGFDYPRDTDIWAAFRPAYVDRGLGEIYIEADIIGRLSDGASADRVAQEIAAVFRNVPGLSAYDGASPVVQPFEDVILGDLTATLLLLFGGGILVLVTACVNVANLVGIRAAGREAWLAVKRALGASRWRLAREAFCEAVWLGLIGGAGGALVAAAAIRILVPLAPPGLARLDLVTPPDGTALLVTAGVTCAVVMVLAVLPVMRSGSVDPARALRAGGRSAVGGHGRRQSAIVIVQAALAVWCAATSMLLVRSFLNLQGLDPGFRVDDLVLVDLVVPYPFGGLPEDFPDRLDRLAGRLGEHPGIAGVTPVLGPPLIGDRGWMFVPRLEGQSPEQAMEENAMPNWEIVQPDYFATLELPILRGRGLTAADRTGAGQVVVVNDRAARLLWPGEEALGKRIGAFGRQAGTEWWTVVGVAADTRYQDYLETRPIVYFPLRQLTTFPLNYLLVRLTGPVDDLLPRIRAAMAEQDPAIRVRSASTLRAKLDAPMARPRFAALILGALAASTLLLAAVGVYGVMMAAVRARSGEVGVRMACGAEPGDIRALLLGRALALAAVGAVLGSLAVLPGAALLESLLFNVAPSDPWSLATAAAGALVMALVACWIPAERAARLDPVRVLRE